VPHADKARREMIEYAIRFHEGFLADAGDEPGVRLDAAFAYLRTGQFRARLGQAVEAADAIRKATVHFEELHRQSPEDATLAKGLTESWNQLVIVLADAGNTAEAELAYTRCDEVFRRIGPAALTSTEYRIARAAILKT